MTRRSFLGGAAAVPFFIGGCATRGGARFVAANGKVNVAMPTPYASARRTTGTP